MIERLSARTYTRKVFDLADGRTLSRCHVGHIHYKNGVAFEDVDLRFTDVGTHWEVTKASYRLQVRKAFDAANLLRWQNRYEGATHDIVYEPHSLRWLTSASMDGSTVFRAQQAVAGVLVSPTQIRFPDAFGVGLDYEVTLRRSGFTKELVIRSFADLAPIPAGASLGIISRYTTSQPLAFRLGGEIVSGDVDDAEGGLDLEESAGVFTRIFPAYAVDASERRARLRVVWQERAGARWQAKVLPRPLLVNATYPLRADTVTSFFAGAGDGRIESETSTSWDAAHDATDGTETDPTGPEAAVMSGVFLGGTLWTIRRAFFPIDTSGLPDADTISAATFYAKVSELTANGDNDGDDWFNIVGPTSQVSNTTLANADFDQCGAINNPTELSDDRKDWSSFTDETYAGWAFNATGLSSISKTGYTLLGLREGHDCIDSPYAGSGNDSNQVRFYTSEQAGTSDDPYLEVTHAAPGTPDDVFPLSRRTEYHTRRDIYRRRSV